MHLHSPDTDNVLGVSHSTAGSGLKQKIRIVNKNRKIAKQKKTNDQIRYSLDNKLHLVMYGYTMFGRTGFAK